MMFKSLSVLLFAAGCFTLSAGNLLKNGGFENGTDGWSVGQRLVKGFVKPDTEKKTEGKQSIRIEITEKKKEKDSRQALAIMSEKIPVVPGTELLYSFQFACKDVQQGEKGWSIARVTIDFYSEEGTRLRWSDVLVIKGTYDWKRYSGKTMVPPKAAVARIRFMLSDAMGTIWVDDVQLSTEGDAPVSTNQLLSELPQGVSVIPTPKKMIPAGKGLTPAQTEPVKGGADHVQVAKKFKQYYPDMKFASLGDQGYFLSADADGICIGANSPAGFRYAAQTLKMLKCAGGYAQYAIADWPSISRRGAVSGLQWASRKNYPELLRRAEKLKLNYIWHTGSFMDSKLNRNWRTPFSESDLAELKNRREQAAAHGLELYLTATPRGIPPVEYSSEKEIDLVAGKLVQIYRKCGVKNIGIAFDDLCNIDQAKLIHESDKAKFPRGIGQAHCWFVTKIYQKVKAACPEVNFLFLPMFYQSYASASPDEIEYTKEVANLPKEIQEWCVCLYTAEDIQENKKLTGRRPLIWDNGYTQGRMPLFPDAVKRPRNTPDEVSGYMFLLAWPQKEDALRITWLITADYMWSSENYVPETTRKNAVAYAVREESVRKIVAEYAKLSRKVLSMDFVRDSKEARLADFRNTIAELHACQKKAETLPPRMKEVLNGEIASYLKELDFQVKNLEPLDYPIVISSQDPKVPQVRKFHPFRTEKTENTIVSLRHDDKNLYIDFKCIEPAVDKMRTKYTKPGSNVFLDDSVELFILPQCGPNDDQVYYQMAINSRGCFMDIKHIRRRFNHVHDEYPEWNSKLQAVSEKGDGFWGLKITVPLKEVGLTGKAGERFFLNLTRNRYAGGKREYSTFAGIPADKTFHFLSAYPMFELQ